MGSHSLSHIEHAPGWILKTEMFLTRMSSRKIMWRTLWARTLLLRHFIWISHTSLRCPIVSCKPHEKYTGTTFVKHFKTLHHVFLIYLILPRSHHGLVHKPYSSPDPARDWTQQYGGSVSVCYSIVQLLHSNRNSVVESRCAFKAKGSSSIALAQDIISLA